MDPFWSCVIFYTAASAVADTVSIKTNFPLQFKNLSQHHLIIRYGSRSFEVSQFGTEQIIILNGSYKNLLPSHSNKHTTLTNLVIIESKSLGVRFPNYIYSSQVLAVFKSLLHKPENVFLIFVKETVRVNWQVMYSRRKTYKQMIKMPAIKLLFTLTSNCDIQSYKFECDSYCHNSLILPSMEVLQKTLTQRSKVNLIHKLLFWNTNRHLIKSHIAYVYSGMYGESKTKRYLCDQVFRKREYHKLYNANYCWAKQMLATEISKAHNITYINAQGEDSYWLYPDSFIRQDETNHLDIKWAHGAYLQYYSGLFAQYCVNGMASQTGMLVFETWITPVNSFVWLVLGLSCLSGSLLLASLSVAWASVKALLNSIFDNMLHISQFFIRSPAHIRKISMLHAIYLLSAFFLYTRYENEITSVVTVEKTVKPFERMHDFFKAGYRIINCNIMHIIRKPKSYYCLQDEDNSEAFILKHKLGNWQQARWNYWYLQQRRASYKRNLGQHVECFNVREEMERKPYFTIVYTLNRHWILQSVQRIHEGGFMNTWNDWAQYSTSNRDRKTFLDPIQERTPDVINFQKLCPVVLFCGFLLCVASLIFFMEVASKQSRSLKVLGKKSKKQLYAEIWIELWKVCVLSLNVGNGHLKVYNKQ